MKYKLGQWIYGIEILDDGEIPESEVVSIMFMAECGEYILGVGKYLHCENFEEQLKEMYEESVEDGDVLISMLRKEYTYATEKEAQEALDKMIEEWNE